MLKKSKKSAYGMACLFLLCGLLTRIIGEMVSGLEAGIYGQLLKYHGEGYIIIPLLLFVSILLIAAGILALFIYSWDGDHFGKWGAMRWCLAGVVYGGLKVGVDLLVSVIGLSGIGKLVEDLLGFLAIVVSYLLLFRVLPQAKKVIEVGKAK